MAKLESRQRELQTESGLKKSKKTRLAEESDLNELIISRVHDARLLHRVTMWLISHVLS